MSKKSPAEVVQDWNAKYPIGTRVRFWPVRPTYSVLPIETRTRTAAYLMSDDADHASIMVEGLVGSVNLSTHVDALPDEPKPAPAEGAAEDGYFVVVHDTAIVNLLEGKPGYSRQHKYIGTRDEAVTFRNGQNALTVWRILPDGAHEAAIAAAYKRGKTDALRNVHALGAVEAARQEGAEAERAALLGYVTGWVREQFRGRNREGQGLGPEDAYDDVKALLQKRSEQTKAGVAFEGLAEAVKGKAPT